MTAPEIVTVERLKAARFAFQMHMNCGAGLHLYQYQCVDFPRLVILKRSHRREGVVVAYVVDDTEVADRGAAAAALNRPPAPPPAPPALQMDLGL